ncbi:piggyBac transposable element-derived protein 4-like [Anastrepha ludens]|uniref:piggyBac transposable element-derived protein 4-like n=1 Tax=Anastrepha ludens TaxID=28586 RepID=UPI0023B09967|nr:piggyBac transposable element-derived protein 4-like [Anastrepha ludens]
MSDSKKRQLESSKTPEVWERWLSELSSSEESAMDEENETEVDEDTDINVNAAEESDHETESELEGSSDDEILSDDSGESHPQNFYLGNDNITKRKKTRPNLQVRIRSHNIIKLLPGTNGNSRNVETEIECLNLFVNDSVIRIIIVSTKLYIQKVRVNFQEDRMNQDARETDDTEIRAFIGILFLIGALRSSRKNLHKIWDNSQGNGVESCYLAMSEKRFRFLLRCLRFDDINTRQQRRAIDKLAAIRELFEVFLVNFQNNCIGSEFLTVDEQLLAFRGRCAFKQYIPSKPAKFGIKTFAMVDAKTS